MNTFSKQLVQARIEDLHRDARRLRTGVARRSHDLRPERLHGNPITIRRATADDAATLRRVADRDSSEVPPAPQLVAEIDGDVRAAMSLVDGALVADPFHYTATIVELLEACATHERIDRRSRLRLGFGPLLHRVARRTGLRVARGPVEVLK
jgi:hypothetical protein